MSDHDFCRAMIRGYKLPGGHGQREFSTFCTFNDTWEVHGPEGFYWYGSAHCAYDARFHAYMQFEREYNERNENA